jgi:hypothetical protein
MLVKGMGYWCDQEAVRESSGRSGSGNKERFVAVEGERSRTNSHLGSSIPWTNDGAGRNPRTVLTPPPSTFTGQHFAAYPVGLIEPLIKASCPAKACPHCGMGWAPIVERTTVEPVDYDGKQLATDPQASQRRLEANVRARRVSGEPHENPFPAPRMLGYRQSCGCPEHTPVPGVVCDPFGGAGTTALVADRLGRDAISIDIAVGYVHMQRDRITADAPLFAQVHTPQESSVQ